MLLLGHSEGGLIALVVAARPVQGVAPAGLILAAPLSVRYLDLLQQQIDGQFDEAARNGHLSAAQAAMFKDRLAKVVQEIRATGKVTTKVGIATVDGLFNPINVRFLRQADQYDPSKLAASLPASLPVLVLRGDKDAQVAAADVDGLVSALRGRSSAKTVYVKIQDVDHTFRIIPGEPHSTADYANPDLTFAPEVEGALGSFLQTHGLLPRSLRVAA